MTTKVYHSVENEIFHIHTSRCKHAAKDPDYKYVEKAIELGAKRIVFTDHAPFPDNPFGCRMDIEELAEYLSSIAGLKREYKDQIEIYCGLEAEYLPSYKSYYMELKKTEEIDLLVLGQHFFEYEPGYYSFSDEDKTNEYRKMCEAMVQGINTEMFDVVAHPDRAFRRCKTFGRKEIDAAKAVIWAATWNSVYLEKNYASMQRKNQYKEDFWKLIPPKALTIYGLDAHSVKEIEDGYKLKVQR